MIQSGDSLVVSIRKSPRLMCIVLSSDSLPSIKILHGDWGLMLSVIQAKSSLDNCAFPGLTSKVQAWVGIYLTKYSSHV